MLEAQKLEQMHIHKTQLAYAEKNMHYQKMLKDVNYIKIEAIPSFQYMKPISPRAGWA